MPPAAGIGHPQGQVANLIVSVIGLVGVGVKPGVADDKIFHRLKVFIPNQLAQLVLGLEALTLEALAEKHDALPRDSQPGSARPSIEGVGHLTAIALEAGAALDHGPEIVEHPGQRILSAIQVDERVGVNDLGLVLKTITRDIKVGTPASDPRILDSNPAMGKVILLGQTEQPAGITVERP